MLFIVNPASASGSTGRRWKVARDELLKRDLSFTEELSTAPGHATILARKALIGGETRVVAVGGDGTLSEVVAGYFDENGQVISREAAVGLLPSGTGSDFCRSLGIANTTDAIDAFEKDVVRRLDIASIALRDRTDRRQRYFINAASFGFGGATVARVNSWRTEMPSWVGGRARFVLAALGALGSYRNRPVRLVIDDQPPLEVLSDLVVVANGRYAGSGMKLAPMADLEDGLLEVLIADGVSRGGIVRELGRVWDGSHIRNPKLRIVRVKSLSISSDPEMPVDIDGESGGKTPASIHVLPGALRFIVSSGRG